MIDPYNQICETKEKEKRPKSRPGGWVGVFFFFFLFLLLLSFVLLCVFFVFVFALLSFNGVKEEDRRRHTFFRTRTMDQFTVTSAGP